MEHCATSCEQGISLSVPNITRRNILDKMLLAIAPRPPKIPRYNIHLNLVTQPKMTMYEVSVCLTRSPYMGDLTKAYPAPS